MKLKPFFCYYGGKYRSAPHYPKPVHDTIIEPFAGSAGYSVRYADHKVILCEADPKIRGIWEYPFSVSPAEVLSLPLKLTTSMTSKIPDEAKMVDGVLVEQGCISAMQSSW